MVSDDPRLMKWFLRLPPYRRAYERWNEDRAVAHAVVFLSLKLADADYFCGRLEKTTTDAETSEKPLTPAQWRTFSREADAFIFAVYGALDAFTQVAATVAGVKTDEEIKFPLLARLLAEQSQQPDRWVKLQGWLKNTYRAYWFRDLRRLRNEVNYRSVLPYPLKRPLRLSGPLEWPTTHAHVVETVQGGLSLLLDEGRVSY